MTNIVWKIHIKGSDGQNFSCALSSKKKKKITQNIDIGIDKLPKSNHYRIK